MDLAKKLSEELANQAQSYGFHRAVSPDAEPRARSYDHNSPQKQGKCKLLNNLSSLLLPFIKNLHSVMHINVSNILMVVTKVSIAEYVCIFTEFLSLEIN